MRLTKMLHTDNAKTTILIRLIVGAVFLSEGIQKFLFPALRGAGRFEKIGLPSPEFLGSFTGLFEILAGLLILAGLFTRLAAMVTLVIILVALPLLNQPCSVRRASGKCCTAAGPTGQCFLEASTCWPGVGEGVRLTAVSSQAGKYLRDSQAA